MNIESLSIAQMIADSQQGENAAKSAAASAGGWLDMSFKGEPKKPSPKEDNSGAAMLQQDKLQQMKNAADLEARQKAALEPSPQATSSYLDSFIKVIGGIA